MKSNAISEYFRSVSGRLFVVEFVLSVEVGENQDSVTAIKTYLIPANSNLKARQAAMAMRERLSHAYKNREGEIVTMRCEGVHSVEELDDVDSDGCLDVSTFLFTSKTTRMDLLQRDLRTDLPLLN